MKSPPRLTVTAGGGPTSPKFLPFCLIQTLRNAQIDSQQHWVVNVRQYCMAFVRDFLGVIATDWRDSQ